LLSYYKKLEVIMVKHNEKCAGNYLQS